MDLEPRSPIARQFHAGVRVAEHRMTDRPAASVRINKKQASQVLISDIGASRAIADRADVHARCGLCMVSAHGLLRVTEVWLSDYANGVHSGQHFRLKKADCCTRRRIMGKRRLIALSTSVFLLVAALSGFAGPRERSAHAGFPERSPTVHRRALR